MLELWIFIIVDGLLDVVVYIGWIDLIIDLVFLFFVMIIKDLIWEPWLILLILEGLGLLLVLNFHLFPIAPLFLWDLATYSIFFFPTLSLAPLQPLKTF